MCQLSYTEYNFKNKACITDTRSIIAEFVSHAIEFNINITLKPTFFSSIVVFSPPPISSFSFQFFFLSFFLFSMFLCFLLFSLFPLPLSLLHICLLFQFLLSFPHTTSILLPLSSFTYPPFHSSFFTSPPATPLIFFDEQSC